MIRLSTIKDSFYCQSCNQLIHQILLHLFFEIMNSYTVLSAVWETFKLTFMSFPLPHSIIQPFIPIVFSFPAAIKSGQRIVIRCNKMDFLREIVGGPKNRFKQNGYNLDLTYITNRIVAMAFPASGIQKLYRNSVDSIRQLLQNSHQNKYITVNISGRNIEEGKLKNVISFEWQDHKAPPFDILFIICKQVAEFLIADPERIAVFHCNHGKGRTGTIICCFFLYLGIFKETDEVMKFYAERRFASEGYGVTQPCQIQYIRYFQKLLQQPSLYPRILTLNSIKFLGDFSFQEPYIKVLTKNCQEIAYNSRQRGDKFIPSSDTLVLKVKQEIALVGDTTIQLKQNRSVGHNLLISYVFNTAFVAQKQVLRAELKQLSPLGKQKQSNFGQNFAMEIQVEQMCNCGDKKNLHGCPICKGALKQQYFKWQRIQQILKFRQTVLPKGQLLCFSIPQSI